MKRYKKILCLLFVTLLLLFSGCSSSSNNGGWFSSFKTDKTPEVDKTGKGLEIDFKIEEDWTYKGQVRYSLSLKNTGLNPVELTKDNIHLTTIIKNKDSTSVFTGKSLEDFYSDLFATGPIMLQHDQSSGTFQGSLYVGDTFYNESTNEDFSYVFNIDYDYITEFNNNIRLTLDEDVMLKPLETVAQAAPVNINKIELIPYSGSEYTLKYYFINNGPVNLNNKDKIINLNKEDMTLKFRGKDINIGNCKAFWKITEGYKEIGIDNMKITQENNELMVACKVDLSDVARDQEFITTTSGFFKYKYKLEETGSIQLPKDRKSEISWE